jgi:L-rhamnose mutarotase
MYAEARGTRPLFAYYEYTGNNYKQDMDTLAREPRNIAWLSQTDAMQIPFAGEHR